MQESVGRLKRAGSGLLVVDIQERLLPTMAEKELVLQNSLRLVRGAQVLGLPAWVTEQYRKGLGPTVREVVDAMPDFRPFEKMTFSAGGAPGLFQAMHAAKVTQVVLCGIEAHVCVTQTCLDLLQEGLQPFVVADAVSSRLGSNHEAALRRMETAGAVIVTTEMALFELLERAGTDEFKRILPLVK